MKRWAMALWLGLAAAAGAAGPAATNRIGIINLGGVDPAMMERIVGHLAANLHTTPKVLPAKGLSGAKELSAEAKALAPLVAGEVVCVIGVAAFPAGTSGHGSVVPDAKCAILNATALKPEPYDAEDYGRRLEKEAIRCAGLLLGMPPCINPRCALFHYTNNEQLDAKGRNFCPPCQVKFDKLQAEHRLQRRDPAAGTP